MTLTKSNEERTESTAESFTTGLPRTFTPKRKPRATSNRPPTRDRGHEKIDIARMQRNVIYALDGTVPQFYGKGPSIKPAVWCDERENRNVIAIDPVSNTCRHAGADYVMAGIVDYVDRLAADTGMGEYWWQDAAVKSCYNLWRLKTRPIAKPKAWGFRSDPALVFNRVAWDLDEHYSIQENPMPLWEELFSRMSDPATFRRYIGSLFVKNAFAQQYLYLHGDGGDGKGCIARFLERILGDDYFGLQKMPADKFFGVPFANRALVCFTDLRDPKFLQSEVIMGLTGGDTLQLERKGVDVANCRSTARLLVMSNLPPAISLSNHDMRRILYCHIKSVGEQEMPPFAYEAGLFAEGPQFLARCIFEYELACPLYGPIRQSAELVEHIKENFARDPLGGEFEDLVDEYFAIYKPEPGQKLSDDCFITASNVLKIIEKRYSKDTTKVRDRFKKWVITQGVTEGLRSVTDGLTGERKRKKSYIGMTARNKSAPFPVEGW